MSELLYVVENRHCPTFDYNRDFEKWAANLSQSCNIPSGQSNLYDQILEGYRRFRDILHAQRQASHAPGDLASPFQCRPLELACERSALATWCATSLGDSIWSQIAKDQEKIIERETEKLIPSWTRDAPASFGKPTSIRQERLRESHTYGSGYGGIF